MVWTIHYAASAAASIKGFDPQIQRRIRAAIKALAEEPERGKALRFSLKGLRSWRTGDFRIVYRIIKERIEVIVIAAGHRQEVYERLRKRL